MAFMETARPDRRNMRLVIAQRVGRGMYRVIAECAGRPSRERIQDPSPL